MKRILLTLAVGLAVGSASLHANVAPTYGQVGTLLFWDLSGATGSQASTTAESNFEDHLEARDLVRGAGLTGASGANSMNASGWNGEANDYFQFGFTVLQDKVNLTQLTIATRSSATGPGTIGLFSSVDGYTNAITTFNQAPGSNYVNSIVNLSSIEQLMNITGDFSFRLKQIGTTSANGGTTGSAGTFRISEYYDAGNYTDLTLTGSFSAIPEPSTYALILGGLALGFVALRRRRA